MNPNQIKNLRRLLGLTQEQLAYRIGVSVSTINRAETGKTKRIHPLIEEKLRELQESAQ